MLISCPLEAATTELGYHAGVLAAALSCECASHAQAAKATLDQHTGGFINLNNFKH